MIYAVVNQKGGAGKTTLAVHLACGLFDAGRRVAFVDGDPQQSARLWLEGAAPDMPVVSPDGGRAVHDAVRDLDASHDAVVCDAPPRLNDTTRVLMYMADQILIPVTPSTVDLRATLQAKQQLDAVQIARREDGIGPADVRLVVNRVRAATEMGRAVIAVLKGLAIPVARQTIGLRDAFARACTEDTTVGRMAADTSKKNRAAARAAKQAADEMAALLTELTTQAKTHDRPHRLAA